MILRIYVDVLTKERKKIMWHEIKYFSTSLMAFHQAWTFYFWSVKKADQKFFFVELGL